MSDTMKDFMDSITDDENEVLSWLHKRCSEVLGKSNYPTSACVKAMADRCSAVSLTKAFHGTYTPNRMVVAMRGIVAKGLVKEFELDGLPCFVPVSRARVVEYTTREMTQNDLRL